MRVVIVVLAAGSSQRLGVRKQDIMYEGETLLERAVRIAGDVSENVIVVTEANNPDAAEGMASSIRAGVRLAGSDARILFTLCDQPHITAGHLRALIATDAPIVATTYAGIRGVPAIFAPQFVPELLALHGDRGARSIINAHHDSVRTIPFEAAAADVDDGDDLRKLSGGKVVELIGIEPTTS